MSHIHSGQKKIDILASATAQVQGFILQQFHLVVLKVCEGTVSQEGDAVD
jgi:hypothetical protein